MRKIISLLGKPCAGKGTRLRQFLEGKEEQYMVVSCGEALREEVENETILGRQAKHYMDAGKLIPDYIIINLVLNQIRKAPEDVSLILDGFPRTLEQAEAALECEMGITHVVNLVVSDAEAISRSESRIICKKCGESYTQKMFKMPKKEGICDKCGGKLVKRSDDKPEIIEERLKIFNIYTAPAIDRMKASGVEYLEIESTF